MPETSPYHDSGPATDCHIERAGSQFSYPAQKDALLIVTYHHFAFVHLAVIVPAFLLGTFLMLRRKGTTAHKLVGRIYLTLMLITGFITLLMPARIGPIFLGHFGLIHLLSVLVLYSVPASYFAARRGDIRTHRNAMIGLYVGGLLIAGVFAFAPGRMLHVWLLG